MKYVLAKLVSGDIVIGKLYPNSEHLEDTYEIQIMPDEQGNMGVAMMPLLYPFVKDGQTVDVSRIMTQEDCPQNLINSYVQMTSGIQITKPHEAKGQGLKLV